MTSPSLNPSQINPSPSRVVVPASENRSNLLDSAISQADWSTASNVINGRNPTAGNSSLLAQNTPANSASEPPAAPIQPVPLSPAVTALLRTTDAESFAQLLLRTDISELASLRWATGVSALQVHFESLPRTGLANTLSRNAAQAQALLHTLALKRPLLSTVDVIPLLADTPTNAALNQQIKTKNERRFDFDSLATLETKKAARGVALAYLGSGQASPKDVAKILRKLFTPQPDGKPSVWEQMKQSRAQNGDQTPLSDTMLVADYFKRVHGLRFGGLSDQHWVNALRHGYVTESLAQLLPKQRWNQLLARLLRDPDLEAYTDQKKQFSPEYYAREETDEDGKAGKYKNPALKPVSKTQSIKNKKITQTNLLKKELNKDSIIIPFTISELPSFKTILAALEHKGLTIFDWDKGLAKNAQGGIVKIKENLPQKLHQMFEHRLTSKSNIVVTINPQKIAEMSTGRPWVSCSVIDAKRMGLYAHQTARDAGVGSINDGAAIAYVTGVNDPTTAKASGRVKIEQYDSQDSKEGTIFATATETLGNSKSDLAWVVSQHLSAHNKTQADDRYDVAKGAYTDGEGFIIHIDIPALSQAALLGIEALESMGTVERRAALVVLIKTFGPELANDAAKEKLVQIYPKGLDLQGVTLEGVNMNGMDLKWVNLSGATIRDSKMQGVDATKSHLYGANFNSVNISYSNFDSSNASNIIINNVTGDRSNFSRMQLNYSSINSSVFGASLFTNANISNSTVNNSVFNIINVDPFEKNDTFFSGADFTNTKISSSVFKYAFFDHSKMEGVSIKNSAFDNALFNYTNLSNSNILWTSFNSALFSSVTFENASLSNIDAQGISADNTDFTDARINHLNIKQASLVNSNVNFAIFQNVLTDTGTDLDGTRLPYGSTSPTAMATNTGVIWWEPTITQPYPYQNTAPTPYSPIPPLTPNNNGQPTEPAAPNTATVWSPQRVSQVFPGTSPVSASPELNPPSSIPSTDGGTTYAPTPTPAAPSKGDVPAGEQGGIIFAPEAPTPKPELEFPTTQDKTPQTPKTPKDDVLVNRPSGVDHEYPSTQHAPTPPKTLKDHLLDNTPPRDVPVTDRFTSPLDDRPGGPTPQGSSGVGMPPTPTPTHTPAPTPAPAPTFSTAFKVPQKYLSPPSHPTVTARPNDLNKATTPPTKSQPPALNTSFSTTLKVNPNQRWAPEINPAHTATSKPSIAKKISAKPPALATLTPTDTANFNKTIKLNPNQRWAPEVNPAAPNSIDMSRTQPTAPPSLSPSAAQLAPAQPQKQLGFADYVQALQHNLTEVQQQIKQLSAQGVENNKQAMAQIDASVAEFFTNAKLCLKGLHSTLQGGALNLLNELQVQWEMQAPGAMNRLSEFAEGAVKLVAFLAALAAAAPGAFVEGVFKGNH